MEPQLTFNVIIAIAGFLSMFVFKVMWDKVEKEREGRARLEEKIAGLGGHYVRRDDFRDHVERIEKALQAIFEKLDEKAPRRRSRA